jgi:hypothetical protein
VTSTQIGRLKLVLDAWSTKLSSGLRIHESIAVEKTRDTVAKVGLAVERDLRRL